MAAGTVVSPGGSWGCEVGRTVNTLVPPGEVPLRTVRIVVGLPLPPRTGRPESQVELALAANGREIVLRPGQASAELDAFLEESGARTWVFLPLVRPGKKRRGLERGSELTQRRARLPDRPWLDGELHTDGPPGTVVPGVFAVDLRRSQARRIAEALGLREYYWGARSTPVEALPVSVLEEEEGLDLETMRGRARDGLRDLVHALPSTERLRGALVRAGADPGRLARVASMLIGIAVVACLVGASGLLAPDATGEARLRGVLWVPFLLAHPIPVTALCLGLYLRGHLGRVGEGEHRELSTAEARDGWQRTSPHMAAVWVLCATSVVLLTAARLLATGSLGPVGLVDASATSLLVCLWILTPLAYARGRSAVLESAVEAAVTMLVAVVVLKVTLFFTNLATRAFWWLVREYVALPVPEWLQVTTSALAAVGAEVFFLGVLLGYTWSKNREHYGRWARVAV